MAAASNYLENKLIDLVLRAQAFTPPSKVYVSLHTGDPNDTGANEVNTTSWPGYARVDSSKGEVSQDAAWSSPVNGTSKNQLQLLFPVYDGSGPLEVTHWCLWDAPSGGNCLIGAPLDVSRTLQAGDVFVIDIEKLTVQVL